MITKFRESASSYIEKVIKAAENSNFLKEKGFTNIKSTYSNEVTFVNSGDNVHTPSGDYITLKHATPELLEEHPSWNAWTASIKLNGITTSQIELKTEDGDNLPLDGDVIRSLIREIENMAPSNKDDSPNSFTVKEVFKENHTKYHYKNHLFESGVNMNKVELMKKAQMYFGRATGYGNNGWLFTDDETGRQAIVEFEGNKIRFSSKRQGRSAQFEDAIDLDNLDDLIKETFIQKCKKAFSEGGRYQESYSKDYSRAGRLFESEGFDVDDIVKELFNFANQYFGKGEVIIDDTVLFTDNETGRSIIVRAIGSKISFYSKRKGRPGMFEDGMDVSDTNGLIEDAVIDKIKYALSEGGRYKESVVRNTLVDRFISQY